MENLLDPNGKYQVSEKNVRNFLKKLPDEKIKNFYETLEFTPFPILLAKEYQKRFNNSKIGYSIPKRKPKTSNNSNLKHSQTKKSQRKFF